LPPVRFFEPYGRLRSQPQIEVRAVHRFDLMNVLFAAVAVGQRLQ
jgi:hypothetical protein